MVIGVYGICGWNTMIIATRAITTYGLTDWWKIKPELKAYCLANATQAVFDSTVKMSWSKNFDL